MSIYDPAEAKRKRDQIRAEIEARRTPEGREEANRIRAQRAAYKALPSAEKKEQKELEVFSLFARISEAGIDLNSGVNRPAPEPDICCTIAGSTCYFELGEITDQPVSRSMAIALKNDEITGCAFSQDQPFEHILEVKSQKRYQTAGTPVELLLYYQTQAAPPDGYFAELLAKNMRSLESLIAGGTFQRIWTFDFARQKVLWRS